MKVNFDPQKHPAYYLILQRCNNPKWKPYKNYGAKGVRCLLTLEEFEKIYYSVDYCAYCKITLTDYELCKTKRTIDRINNHGNYEKDNIVVCCHKCNNTKNQNTRKKINRGILQWHPDNTNF